MNIIDYLQWDDLTEIHDNINRVFIVDKEKEITIKKFLENSVNIAKALADRGIFDSPIAVIANQNWLTLSYYMGILLSGNYYISLSPELTKERKDEILLISKAKLICCEDNVEHIVETLIIEDNVENIDLAADLQQLSAIRENLPSNPILYEIFTSGSTGKPKGIIKRHNAMISFLEAYIGEFGFSKADVLANQTPFYFDASAKDIYLAFKLKCTLHIFDKKMFIMPKSMMEYFNKYKVSVIQWVPSALCILSKLKVFDSIKPQYLKKVFFVGEVFPIQQLKIWMDALPNTRFINLYGSSEMCGICAYYEVSGDLEDVTLIPIGKPLRNTTIKLMSEGTEISEQNEIGEIYVQTEALADGYIGLEENKETVLAEYEDGRWYASGDLAKYNGENLCFVSRKDYQIKHMGHRIELGEIEQITQKIEGVNQVCCIYDKDRIQLFYSGRLEKREVSEGLKSRMPSYMLPNKIIKMDLLPINSNGKIDRQKILGGL